MGFFLQILGLVTDGKSWKEAILHVLPARKGVSGKVDQDEDEKEQEEKELIT